MNMTTGTDLKNLLRLNRTASPDQASDKPAPAASVGAGADEHRDRARIGWIVLGSMAAGLLAAVVLAAAPFMPPTEEGVTGAVLIGFAVGWALLAVLSTRFSDQPQRWAAAPALFMGVSGVIVMRGSTWFVHEVLAWVWPPALLVLVIWMFAQARRQLHSRTRGWVLNPVLVVMVLVAVGAGYETARESIDARVYAMPGQLVDVGGHRMHLSCTGEGSPTVVLEPGAGGMSSTMGLIAPAVARDTRVCVYDRAGRGWSDPAEGTQDGTRIATDLHTLLHTAGIPGPYVLAGHSFGGLYVRSYAAQYPDDVAGLVLVDSTEATTTTTLLLDHLRAAVRAPTTPWVGCQQRCRPRHAWAWDAWSPNSPTRACPQNRAMRPAPGRPPPSTPAAPSTSTSPPTTRWNKPDPWSTSPGSRWSC